MIPYGVLRRLRRGIKVSAFVTLRCSFNCPYCSLKGFNGIMPMCDEISFDEWFEVLRKIEKTILIQEINITGGEPLLRVGIAEFINKLLDSKKCVVSLYTNLCSNLADSIIANPRFRIVTTYHHRDDPVKYLELYRHYKRKHRVVLEEIDYKVLDYTDYIKPYEIQAPGVGGQTDRFAIAPDGEVFLDMQRFYKHMRYK